MSAMYNFLFDRKSLILLLVGLTLGGGMLFFAGVLVGVYWSLPNGTTLQAAALPRPALFPAREIAPVAAPPPAVPDPSPVALAPVAPEPPAPAGSAIAEALNEAAGTAPPASAASGGPLSTAPTIELPTGPAPEEAPGPIAGTGESIGLPKTPLPAPHSPIPLVPVPPPLAAVKPHPARQPSPRLEPPEPPFSPAVASGESGEGRYTIQVGAYALVENSQETVAALSRRGYAPYVVDIQGTRGVLHVVRVGRFPDRGTAARAASDLRRKARMEAIVQPVRKEARNAGNATGSAPTSG
jgi:cell division septation protein DedD